MKTSEQGRKLLIEREIVPSEGIPLRAYRDSEGYWTIGVGHLLSLDKNADFSDLAWTREHAEEVFAQDLAKYEQAVDHGLRVAVKQNQYDALVSMGHNIGAIGIMNSEVIHQINKGDLVAAAAAFDNWHKPTSIISRRNGEKAQFMGTAFFARLDADPVSGQQAPPMLRRGDQGDAVIELQHALGINPDGAYGSGTEAAVRAFQNMAGLYPDGVAGPKTLAALQHHRAVA